MQWSPSLVLLLCAAAAVSPLTCHFRTRYGPTVGSLQNASWDYVDYNRTHSEPKQTWACSDRGWVACGRWLIDWGTSYGADYRWQDYYAGCYSSDRRDGNAQLVRKYCVDSPSSSCNTTQFFTNYRVHKPAILCCCRADKCDTQDIHAYAEQQRATKTTPKPPQGPKQKVSCERSTRTAATRDGLSAAEPTSEPDEQCEEAWAPCVEFVYKNPADGLWRLWRAGCSYHHGAVSYSDIVEQFCSASYECAEFDMLEPESRATGQWTVFKFTRAYACCCGGTGCHMPDTVAFSNGIPQTPPPPTTTALAEVTPPPPTTTALAEVTPTDGDGGSVVWLWLLLVVVVLLVAIVAIVAATVIVDRRKQKATEKQPKEQRGVETALPFSAFVPLQTSSGAAPTMDDKSGSPESTSGK